MNFHCQIIPTKTDWPDDVRADDKAETRTNDNDPTNFTFKGSGKQNLNENLFFSYIFW